MSKCFALAKKCRGISGIVNVPGDKSISHRSLLIPSQALGVTKISGLLEGDDVLATMHALQAMGVKILPLAAGEWEVHGVGAKGLRASEHMLDMGNTGTGVRLLMGLAATYNFATSFTGDESLRSRPMKRILDPLKLFGTEVLESNNFKLPLTIKGTDGKRGDVLYELPVASAQVKSAILLAGLNNIGNTIIIEPHPTRDHTEIMLANFGADIEVSRTIEGKNHITLKGNSQLRAIDINIPGDPSSAAFLVVAALIVPNSNIIIRNVCINIHRVGLYDVLIKMGGNIIFENIRIQSGEKVADIRVRSSNLHGVIVPENIAPSMIDEYPILSVAASAASGVTLMKGLKELRVKESNRLEAIAKNLALAGVNVKVDNDDLEIVGGNISGGVTVETFMDHRIAMSFLILGLIAEYPVSVDDISMIKTSFPTFITLMNQIGAAIE